MPGRNTDWTDQWVAEKIATHEKVASASRLAPQRIHVVRKELPELIVGTTAVERFDAEALSPILDNDPEVSFVVNVPKEAYITGSALELAASCGVPIGGISDLLRGLSLPVIRSYVNKEFAFIERGLQQHS